jgi:hypothetical protein
MDQKSAGVVKCRLPVSCSYHLNLDPDQTPTPLIMRVIVLVKN